MATADKLPTYQEIWEQAIGAQIIGKRKRKPIRARKSRKATKAKGKRK